MRMALAALLAYCSIGWGLYAWEERAELWSWLKGIGFAAFLFGMMSLLWLPIMIEEATRRKAKGTRS